MSITTEGNFNSTERLLNSIVNREYLDELNKIAKQGAEELSRATPTDTGKTANSWYYTIKSDAKTTMITWSNSNMDENGTPIVILLRHGHVTNDGAFIEGKDFITPAIKPVFDNMLYSLRKALM